MVLASSFIFFLAKIEKKDASTSFFVEAFIKKVAF
jgi:hypothetical protein